MSQSFRRIICLQIRTPLLLQSAFLGLRVPGALPQADEPLGFQPANGTFRGHSAECPYSIVCIIYWKSDNCRDEMYFVRQVRTSKATMQMLPYQLPTSGCRRPTSTCSATLTQNHEQHSALYAP